MGNMRNMHRIIGSMFEHIKPNLCPFCKHYRNDPDGWDGRCVWRVKRLSAPITDKARCPDFDKAEQPHWEQSKIDEYMADGAKSKERRKSLR